MKIAIFGPPGFSNILPAFKALEPYERKARCVVAHCEVAAEWAHYLGLPLVDGDADTVVSLFDDELI